MQSNETMIVVEELPLEEWLLANFKAERAPRRAHKFAGPIRPVADVSRVGGAKALYWCWLAGALLAYVLR